MIRKINPEELFIGKEPIWWEEELPLTVSIDSKLGDSFNYYNYRYSLVEAYKFTQKHVSLNYSKEIVQKFNSLKEWQVPSTLGWISRMLSLGCDKIPPDMMQRFCDGLDKCIKKNYKPSIRIVEKAKYIEKTYIHSIDSIIDEYITKFDKKKCLNDIQELKLDKKTSLDIQNHYQGLFDELSVLIHGNVESIPKSEIDQIEEAYSCYSKEQLVGFFALIQGLYSYTSDILEGRIGNKVVKEVPFHKKLTKLLYLKEISELEIKAINISKLFDINASIFVFYESKTKKIIVAYKDKEVKLDINGKAILGFREAFVLKSKTPETHAKLFHFSTKTSLNKLIKEFKNKKPLENFKINSNTILLKVF
jgi:hypothetical protein